MATTGRILPVSLDTRAAGMYAADGGEDLGEVAFRVDRSTFDWFEMANFGGVGVGVNMAFRRELFESGWGFRESLGLGAGILGEEHYAFFTIIRRAMPSHTCHRPSSGTTFRRRRRHCGA